MADPGPGNRKVVTLAGGGIPPGPKPPANDAERGTTLPDFNWHSALLPPFERAEFAALPEHKITELAAAFGVSETEMRASLDQEFSFPVFVNGEAGDSLKVQVRPYEAAGAPMLWLTIQRLDAAPIRDWRIMQEVKNMAAGPECEAVELYPAESRVVDTANAYHLFCLKTPGARFPFGMAAGKKLTNSVAGSTQRPFAPGSDPAPGAGQPLDVVESPAQAEDWEATVAKIVNAHPR